VGPPFIQRDANGKVVRMNLSYYYFGCFSHPKGFDEGQLAELRAAMPSKAVAEQLDEWFREKLYATQEETRLCFPGIIWQFPTYLFLWPLYCAQKRDRVRKWQAQMMKWQDDINDQLLIPNGMFLKTQSERPFVICGRLATKRWFAIALTPKEAEVLDAEKHVFGRTRFVGCSCLGEKNPLHDEDLCMHHP